MPRGAVPAQLPPLPSFRPPLPFTPLQGVLVIIANSLSVFGGGPC